MGRRSLVRVGGRGVPEDEVPLLSGVPHGSRVPFEGVKV